MSLLFDISPTEDGKSKARKNRPATVASSLPPRVDYGESDRYLMSLDQVPCNVCGLPADLIQVLLIKGSQKWRVQCGWWCMHTWLIDPIPGLLDPKPDKKSFVLRAGRYAGKTFDEAWDSGGEWYLRDLSQMSESESLTRACREFLESKNRLT